MLRPEAKPDWFEGAATERRVQGVSGCEKQMGDLQSDLIRPHSIRPDSTNHITGWRFLDLGLKKVTSHEPHIQSGGHSFGPVKDHLGTPNRPL